MLSKIFNFLEVSSKKDTPIRPQPFTNEDVSEKMHRIRAINQALKKVFIGQKKIDDVIDTSDTRMNEAEFFNRLLQVFDSEKIVELNIQEFLSNSIRALVNHFDTGLDATSIFNIDANAKQRLKTTTFFNMLLYAFEFMYNYIRLEDTYKIGCSMSEKGAIVSFIGTLRNNNEHKFRSPAKYAADCPNTQFLVFNCVALLAKENNYTFSVLQDSTTISFKFAPIDC